MATEPVLVDSALIAQVRASASDDVAGFVDSAVRLALRDRELLAVLAEVESEIGQPTDELLAEAEAFWRAG
ncbi:MAG: hypothetical protein ACT4OS_07170 [Acidimicrobiales bacterium]